jgi:hypothetical protein
MEEKSWKRSPLANPAAGETTGPQQRGLAPPSGLWQGGILGRGKIGAWQGPYPYKERSPHIDL